MDQSFDYFQKEIVLLVIFVKWFWSRHFLLLQWVICLHTTWWNHISSVSSCLVAIDIVFSILYHKGHMSSNTVGWSWYNSNVVIISLNNNILIAISFYMSIHLTCPFPLLHIMAGGFWNDFDVGTKNCVIFESVILTNI